MKARFSSLDIIAILPELKDKLCTGWRVNQVYDCDYKTYLFKLNKSIVKMKKDDDPINVDEETANKMMLIIESGLRIHTTDYDWPKSHAPSAFASKLRKFIRNKRIEDIQQIGIDRIIRIQFGTNQVANHLIIELYDKGNLILTDYNYSILAILRWKRPSSNYQSKDGDGGNLSVGQVYPIDQCRGINDLPPITEGRIVELLNNSKIIMQSNQNYKKRNKAKRMDDDGILDVNLKDLINPHVIYGGSLLEDKLLKHVFNDDISVRKCIAKIPIDSCGQLDQDEVKLYAKSISEALKEADAVLEEVKEKKISHGYIVQKKQADSNLDLEVNNKTNSKQLTTNIDFFPILSCAARRIQQEPEGLVYQEFESFDKAVDVYYCNLESQRIDSKAFAAEKDALKKLENLKVAQEKRLGDLAKAQKEDEYKARLIEVNCDKVEEALLIIRSMIANQISWSDIWQTIKEAQSMKDPIASLITAVNFERNQFTMKLCDPYDLDSDGGNHENNKKQKPKFKNIEIDINLSAYANARRFFVKRRTAVDKEKKTIEVSKKAFKNVERRTKEMLKEVEVKTNITKARKRYWFENFFWFISSDGYLVVAGRDAEQNDLLVKRYMKNNDIYVHGDLHGASSVIIKNEFSAPVPPKTLVEAGCMAVCYSSAWDSKIATTSWWVYPKQVSKTAPSGEYLTMGAFIIRGKKNYLPLSNLILGFGFLFRLGEESIERRRELRIAHEENEKFDEPVSTDQACDDINKEQLPISSDEQSPSDSSGESDTESTVHTPKDEHESKEINLDRETTQTELNDDTLNDGDDDDIDDDNRVIEHRLIDTLTECPLADDILLYAIPMCGPYSALQSFKYKVKVIPGTSKRGKAAKTCLGTFLHDKRASQREKDLLKALKDQDYARNIPNKVKISSIGKSMQLTKKKPKKSEVRLPFK